MTPAQPQIEQYNVNQALASQNEPSEQLSESSESAFGDDNMVSPQPPQTEGKIAIARIETKLDL